MLCFLVFLALAPQSWHDIEPHNGAFEYFMLPNDPFTSVMLKDFCTREQPHRDIINWFLKACPGLRFEFK